MTTANSVVLTAPRTRWWPGWLLPPATILPIVMAAVLLLTTPIWMHVSIPAAGGGLPGRTTPETLQLSDRTVDELLFGPGTFEFRNQIPCDATSGCPLLPPFYTADEAAHLRDARAVLYLFVGLAAVSLIFLIAAAFRWRRDVRYWRGLRRGGSVLVVGTIVLGVIGAFAFEPGFELFHRIFFPGGNWSFGPDSNLIRLYPYVFWQLTAGALGVMCVAAGAAVWLYSRRRMARLEARP